MPNKREALQLLKKHFPQVSISEDDAVLLASPITTHGGLLEVRRAAFSKTLDKLEAALTATLKKAPYYAAKRFRAWDRELKEFRATPKLFGKQNSLIICTRNDQGYTEFSPKIYAKSFYFHYHYIYFGKKTGALVLIHT